MNSYIVLDSGISMSVGMKPYNVDRSHPNFNSIVEALKAAEWDSIPDLVNLAKSIVKFVGDKFVVDTDHGRVEYLGEELHGMIVERILSMMAEGFDIEPLVNFLDNLLQNPSKRAVDELYGFLENGKMPITPDGHFLAYKRVRSDYMSVHDGRTNNSLGNVVEMVRNAVDDDKDRTCSAGLHFCSVEYLCHYSGEKIMVLKINPRDVVSIPVDYNNAKGRACRYEVVGELTNDEVGLTVGGESIWSHSVVEDYDDMQEADFEDRDTDLVEDLELVTADYLTGYNKGRVDGRKGNTVPGGAVIVMHVPVSPEEYVEGYKRGWKEGKAHKAKALLAVIPTDNEIFDDHDADDDVSEDVDGSSVEVFDAVNVIVAKYVGALYCIDPSDYLGQDLGLDDFDLARILELIDDELDSDERLGCGLDLAAEDLTVSDLAEHVQKAMAK